MTNSNYKLTKEDFNQINKRSLFTFQLGWNYERMQASGYLYMILPQLRKMYGDGTPELKEMMKVHTQFFNTSPFFHTIIAGFDLAMGFGLTAMLTVLYSNVISLGGAVAGIIGTLPAEVAQTIGFANNFKGLSMIGISIIGIFLAVVHFKNSQKVAVAAPSTQSESGEIEDDEF